MTATYRDYLLLHFIIILWGFTAILGLLIKIPPVELVFFRTLLAMSGLGVIIWLYRVRVRIGHRNILKLLGTGLLISAHWILFFGSARVSTASVCLAGIATTSFWTSILEPLSKGQKIQLLEVFFGSLMILGLYLIFHFEVDHAVGLLLALASALLAATFTVINSHLTHSQNQYVISFYEMMGAFITTALFLPIYALTFAENGSLQLSPLGMDWFYLSILAFVCTVYPFAISIELMKRISAFLVNLSVNMEPVYGIVLAVLIFGEKEKMNAGFYMGTLVILSSVILYPVLRRLLNRRKRKHLWIRL
ncbi:MAG: DMT family transporter [Cyclobacteriaceae bacterium]|nr:DMT family transporter [Cyclobacteriaceae bacterium]